MKYNRKRKVCLVRALLLLLVFGCFTAGDQADAGTVYAATESTGGTGRTGSSESTENTEDAESAEEVLPSEEPEYYEGEGYDIIYQDKAGLVDDVQHKEEILSYMKEISAYANVIFYTTDEYEASEAAKVCEKVCGSYYGSSKKVPTVMFTIDMFNREIYLYCTGPTRHIIRNRDALSITDNIYRLASAQRYGQCAARAFEQCVSLLSGSSIRRPMQRINNLFLAVILGFLFNYLYLKMSRKWTANKEKLQTVLKFLNK